MLEHQTKQDHIRAKRDQECFARSSRIGYREKWQKGPILGPGPLPASFYNLNVTFDEPHFVYDLHGRRHGIRYAGDIAAQSFFDSAMKKIQRALAQTVIPTKSNNLSLTLLDYFKRYDFDKSGKLDALEFAEALADMKISLTSEQQTILFQYFDPNGSGAINYGEV